MNLVVADTGPLRYLIVVEAIHVLPGLFQKIMVPPRVIAELRHPHAPSPVRDWANELPAWIDVRKPQNDREFQRLDPGESEALGLAIEIRASLILLDEREARREAIRLGLSVSGTVGILERAAAAGLLNLEVAFSRLSATNFRIDRSYMTEALERNRARNPNLEP